MRIAIIGSRGIPAKYGGFETFAEGLSTRLVEKGYDVTVSCEYQDPNERFEDYHGVKLSYFPLKPPNSYFLRKIYENLSDIYFLFKLVHRSDVIYFLGTEVGMFLFIPKLLKRNIKLMVNIDGVMWKRTKFNRLERWLLKINHNFATRFSDVIVADAEEMKKYVNSKYRNKAVFIPYGVEEVEPVKWDINKLKNIESFSNINISKNKFWLVVARLEPENNIHMIVEGFSRANSKYPLVIVGDFTSEKYEKEIKDIVSGSFNIHLVGSIYDLELLNMLRQHNFAYIHGHSVGGTNPSLLEAMIMKSIIVAHDNGFNREVCVDGAFYFNGKFKIDKTISKIENNVQNYLSLKTRVFAIVKTYYSWKVIFQNYKSLFEENNF
jgi:rhamnosyltransferase